MRTRSVGIPLHKLELNEFFLLERIEHADIDGFIKVHRHNFYEILWFTDAEEESSHSIDFKTYQISSNDIFILSPYQTHIMDVQGKKGYLVPIAIDFFESLFQQEKELLIAPYFLKVSLEKEISEVLF